MVLVDVINEAELEALKSNVPSEGESSHGVSAGEQKSEPQAPSPWIVERRRILTKVEGIKETAGRRGNLEGRESLDSLDIGRECPDISSW